jgi:hypothetical protein
MKKQILFYATLLIVMLANSSNIFAQDNYASTLKLGPFKLGMHLEQAEILINRQISVSEAKLTANDYEKWTKATIAGVTYSIGFSPEYNEDEEAPKKYTIARVKCADPSIKTKSGIAIGMSKLQAFKILDDQKLDYTYTKYTETDDKGNKTGKVHEHITITDDKAGKALSMELKEGKIINFSLEYGGDGC